MSPPAVEIRGLTKAYGETRALAGIDATVEPGEIFGFLGPDGAGKTTLFRILCTLLLADAGSARVLGLDVEDDLWAIRRQVGYMPGRFSLYLDLTVEENVRFFATAFGTTLEAQRDVIAPIYDQIAPFSDRAAGALSGGMKQKLALCCALVHRPGILFLDEPTTGVDAVSRREFWDLLENLRDGGLTVVVSTPYMDEADRCDRVALIQEGALLAMDTPAALVAGYPLPLLEVRGGDRVKVLAALRDAPWAHSAYPFGTSIHYTDARAGRDPAEIRRDVAGHLAARGLGEATVTPAAAGIEDLFMYRMAASGHGGGAG
ncbi:MAG TPA: ABC transporter ATP-binding protein [Longimicrobiales bacterium]|nr:ABC transporter ATP-binding protein [Longimicrobiales bacterium]